ncbi:hypothetical protein CBM2587_A80005 [Cupriavidus taiwanensis]|uniref:Uncharacterized protein n=1 Tax=Cupriavidus taiwanensis TaxID=164546 RepID=A0A375BWC1_9BURK|nr:hypothetical protein CBM2587_A80005 [Cupriavidus taiwanensis]
MAPRAENCPPYAGAAFIVLHRGRDTYRELGQGIGFVLALFGNLENLCTDCRELGAALGLAEQEPYPMK